MPSLAAGEDELVREALDGLFEIASEDRPADVRASLHEQIDELPAEECRTLVEQMVDTDGLAERIRQRSAEGAEQPPRAPDEQLSKVDDALEPLVAWTMGEEGARALEGLDDEDRFHVLFSSLGPG